MDFDKLKMHVVAASTKFQNFDQMAANDEYLKTEGLNVKRRGSASSNRTANASTGGSVKASAGAQKQQQPNTATINLKQQKSPSRTAYVSDDDSRPTSPVLQKRIESQTKSGETTTSSAASSRISPLPRQESSGLSDTIDFTSTLSVQSNSVLTTGATATSSPMSSYVQPDKLFDNNDDDDDGGILGMEMTTSIKTDSPKEWSLLDRVDLPSSWGGQTGDNSEFATNNNSASAEDNTDEAAQGSREWIMSQKEKPQMSVLSVVAALMKESNEGAKETNTTSATDPSFKDSPPNCPRSAAAALVAAAAEDALNEVGGGPSDVMIDLDEHIGHKSITSDHLSLGTLQSMGTNEIEKSDFSNLSESSDSEDDSHWGDHPDDDEHDPIMDLIRKSKKGSAEKKAKKKIPKKEEKVVGNFVHVTKEKIDLTEAKENIEGAKRKDPNRFMSDLDKRFSSISLGENIPSSSAEVDEINPATQVSPATHISMMRDIETASVDADDDSAVIRKPLLSRESFAEASNKIDWLKKVAGPGLQTVQQNVSSMWIERVRNNPAFSSKPSVATETASSMTTPAFSRKNPNGQKQDSGMIQDDYNVVVSSSILADEEHAELERLRENARSSGNPILMIRVALERNPQFTFIGLTMILASLVYFYSRKRAL